MGMNVVFTDMRTIDTIADALWALDGCGVWGHAADVISTDKGYVELKYNGYINQMVKKSNGQLIPGAIQRPEDGDELADFLYRVFEPFLFNDASSRVDLTGLKGMNPPAFSFNIYLRIKPELEGELRKALDNYKDGPVKVEGDTTHFGLD